MELIEELWKIIYIQAHKFAFKKKKATKKWQDNLAENLRKMKLKF